MGLLRLRFLLPCLLGILTCYFGYCVLNRRWESNDENRNISTHRLFKEKGWQPTMGMLGAIVDKRHYSISTGKNSSTFRADYKLRYLYEVNGKNYTADAWLRNLRIEERTPYHHLDDRNRMKKVFYNPNNPQESQLEFVEKHNRKHNRQEASSSEWMTAVCLGLLILSLFIPGSKQDSAKKDEPPGGVDNKS